MSSDDLRRDAHELLDEALEAFPDEAAQCAIAAARARLDEPLRIAVAGMVKAGKSTLLNAVIGDEIAPTDAGECTRVVTWYRYGRTPRIVVHPRVGDPVERPVRRVDGRLALDLGGLEPDAVERLEIEWPTAGLRETTLIDTPGIASLSTSVAERSERFLRPADAPSQADAIVYLMRHVHEADLGFLDSFHDAAAGASSTVNALAVLSRADEVGSGRIDAMLSAHDIAARYRRDDALRALALDVVPVAGLLAQSARTMRQWEFDALLELSQLDRDARDDLLVSVDRFVRGHADLSTPPRRRAQLLDRFGVFGIRVATALLRGPAAASSTDLAQALRVQSGLDHLLAAVATMFGARADLLKARAAIQTAERLLRRSEADGGTEAAARVAASIERLESSAHGLRELRLVARIRTTGSGLDAALEREAERLVGACGDGVRERLGLAADASDEDAAALARATAQRWRARASDPLLPRPVVRVCELVARSAEAQLARLGPSRGRVRARLSLGAEPVARAG